MSQFSGKVITYLLTYWLTDGGKTIGPIRLRRGPTNDQFWEKCVADWRTDGQTDRRKQFYRTLELFKFGSKNQKKVMKQSWEKQQRPYFRPFFDPFCPKKPKIRIFPKNRATSVLYPYGTLTSCKKCSQSESGPSLTDWLGYLLLLTTDQLILLHHNMNCFKPFAVKSNDSNSIMSLKSLKSQF